MKLRTSDVIDALELSGQGGEIVGLQLSGILNDGRSFVATDCILLVPVTGLAPLNVNVTSSVTDTFVEVAPSDLNLGGDGFAKFARSYHEGTVVSVTASWTSNGLRFLRWTVDGALQPVGLRTTNLVVTDETTLEAIYDRAPAVDPQSPGPPSGLE